MTTRGGFEVERRRGNAWQRPKTLAASLALALKAAAAEEAASDESILTWPSTRYRRDPVGFFREVLGIDPWSKQIELIEAVRDHDRVAAGAGHKVSKTNSAVGLALWFFCSFEDARVVMSSTTSRQVDEILWRELRMLRHRAGKCLACKAADPSDKTIPRPCPHSALIGGQLADLARSGLRDGFREIVGFTAKEAEAVAGISGKNIFYIIDEASGVPDKIFEGIEGNRAGGAKLLMISNPTRTEGEFAAAFYAKSSFYKTLKISSEESPNVVTGRDMIPGLATRSWIEEKRREWGEDSPLYKVRVKGEFVLAEDGKILTLHAIMTAELRWSETPETGRLYIGLDPAGPGGAGDESVFALRRGQKVIQLIGMRGLNEEAHLVHLLGLIGVNRQAREECPIVVLDREGPIGSRLFGLLRSHVDGNPDAFEIVGVRASDRASRQPQIYDRARDELFANLEAWLRGGGAIPEDARLERELHAASWSQNINGRLKATPKEELRKTIGHSPDRADAVALAVWEVSALAGQAEKRGAPPAEEDRAGALDPYGGGGDMYGATFDPYR